MSSKTGSRPSGICAASVTLGIICVILKIISLLISDSPYDMIHKLDKNNIIPSMWIWNLASIFMVFLAGIAAGIIATEVSMGRLDIKKERFAYRGALYFISMIFLSVIHYPLFFSCERILISFLISIITLICATACAVLWSSVASKATLLMGANAFYCVYVAFINLNILAIN